LLVVRGGGVRGSRGKGMRWFNELCLNVFLEGRGKDLREFGGYLILPTPHFYGVFEGLSYPF
jgi:hypothetical protein